MRQSIVAVLAVGLTAMAGSAAAAPISFTLTGELDVGNGPDPRGLSGATFTVTHSFDTTDAPFNTTAGPGVAGSEFTTTVTLAISPLAGPDIFGTSQGLLFLVNEFGRGNNDQISFNDAVFPIAEIIFGNFGFDLGSPDVFTGPDPVTDLGVLTAPLALTLLFAEGVTDGTDLALDREYDVINLVAGFSTPNQIAEPATLGLIGAGLTGLAIAARRRSGARRA